MLKYSLDKVITLNVKELFLLPDNPFDYLIIKLRKNNTYYDKIIK
jgi:hypothetical protein